MRALTSTGSAVADVWLGTMVVFAFAVWALVAGEVWALIRNRTRGK